MRNRVQKIKELLKGLWRHVPTMENQSDLGTRKVPPQKLKHLWFKGHTWMSEERNWPKQQDELEIDETAMETVKGKDKAMPTMDQTDIIIEPFNYERILRVTAGILRFKETCKRKPIQKPLQSREFKIAE